MLIRRVYYNTALYFSKNLIFNILFINLSSITVHLTGLSSPSTSSTSKTLAEFHLEQPCATCHSHVLNCHSGLPYLTPSSISKYYMVAGVGYSIKTSIQHPTPESRCLITKQKQRVWNWNSTVLSKIQQCI